LPRVVQDRFLSATAGTFPPSPLLRSVSAAKANAPVVWVVLAVFASALGVVLFRRGFGTLGDARSLHSAGMGVVFAALVAIVVLASLRAIAMFAEARVLPYAPGVYLFPTTLIDARRATLEVLPLTELVSIEAHPGALHLVFAGGRPFTFDLPADVALDELVVMIEGARAKSKELANDPDPSGYYALVDPLHEPPKAAEPSVEPKITLRMPAWARHAFVTAALAGAVVGPALRWKRNEASDERMFAEVRGLDTVTAYRAYLTHGGAHHDEVLQVWLPRAEQRDARAAMMAELDRARKVGTLAALRAFETAHPDHGLPIELAAAKHAVYAAALERYRPLAADADALAFVTRLLTFSEDHGPTVHVRFVRAPSPTLVAADHAVESSTKFAGITSYPSRYFDDEHAAAVEARLLASLRARLLVVFPEEIVTLVAAPNAEPGAKDMAPMLTIEHHVEWSGDPVTTIAPPAVLVTPSFELVARFTVPDDGVPGALVTMSTTVPSSIPDLTGIERKEGAAPPEDAIYRAISAEAFDRFGDTLLARFLR
jgi:hypothetical protein